MNHDYRLKSIDIRKAENGYVLCINKELTNDGYAKRAKRRSKTAGEVWSSHESEEYVTESKSGVLKRVRAELDEYASDDVDKKSDGRDSEGNSTQAGGIGFH